MAHSIRSGAFGRSSKATLQSLISAVSFALKYHGSQLWMSGTAGGAYGGENWDDPRERLMTVGH